MHKSVVFLAFPGSVQRAITGSRGIQNHGILVSFARFIHLSMIRRPAEGAQQRSFPRPQAGAQAHLASSPASPPRSRQCWSRTAIRGGGTVVAPSSARGADSDPLISSRMKPCLRTGEGASSHVGSDPLMVDPYIGHHQNDNNAFRTRLVMTLFVIMLLFAVNLTVLHSELPPTKTFDQRQLLSSPASFPCFEQCCFGFVPAMRHLVSFRDSSGTVRKSLLYAPTEFRPPFAWGHPFRRRTRLRRRDVLGRVKNEWEVFQIHSKDGLQDNWGFFLRFFGNDDNPSEGVKDLEHWIRSVAGWNSGAISGVEIQPCLVSLVRYLVRVAEGKMLKRTFGRSVLKIWYFFRLDRRIDGFSGCVHFLLHVFGEERWEERTHAGFRTIHLLECPVASGGTSMTLVDVDSTNDESARVNFVVPIKNRGRALEKLVLNLQHVMSFDESVTQSFRKFKSGLPRVRVVVFDYASTDLNVKRLLENDDRFVLLQTPSDTPWNKVYALQRAIDFIDDDNEIVFVTDADMILPYDFAHRVRSHVEYGKALYFPVCFSFNGGNPETYLYDSSSSSSEKRKWSNTVPWRIMGTDPDYLLRNGYWRVFGTGMVGAFVKDMKNLGGYDTEQFSDKWGLEDTDLLLRAVRRGYNIHRLREMQYFHRYHPKADWKESEYQA